MFQKWMGRVYGWQDTGAVPTKKKENKQTNKRRNRQTNKERDAIVC